MRINSFSGQVLSGWITIFRPLIFNLNFRSKSIWIDGGTDIGSINSSKVKVIFWSGEILNLLSDSKSYVRKKAAKSLGKILGQNVKLFATITNTLAKDKSVNDHWRKLPNPVSSRNLYNVVEDEVVESLAKSVITFYPRLSHRYYSLKAKWFGVKYLIWR